VFEKKTTTKTGGK